MISDPGPKLFRLIDQFAATGAVTAIGVGGSQASGVASMDSDVDIYVITREGQYIDPVVRQGIIEPLADDLFRMDIHVSYWGDEDGLSIDGVWHDLAHFDEQWFQQEMDAVLIDHRARLGYSTSFMYTLDNMVPLYDPEEKLATWKRRTGRYPEELARSILFHNYPAACSLHSSYRNQITRAVQLNDPVAVNHRVAAFLACVFDMVFAHLRMWHPGEKRQMQHLQDRSNDLPRDFDAHIRSVLEAAAPDTMAHQLTPAIETVADDMTSIVEDYL